MSKAITVKAAKDALNNLRKLKPANEKYDDELEMSIKEAVFFMAPDLIQFAKRGFTSKELSAGLAADAIDIKPGTLNRYLNEYLVARQNVEKSDGASGTDATDNEKKDTAVESKSTDSASHPNGLNDASDEGPSIQGPKNITPKSENQTGGPFNGKERASFNNPKTPPENPNPGVQPGGPKSEWARAAEGPAAPNRPKDYQSK